MPIILKQPDKVQVKNNDYIWDREQRKLVKKENAAPAKEEYVSAKTETYWDPTIRQLVTKPEPPKPPPSEVPLLDETNRFIL